MEAEIARRCRVCGAAVRGAAAFCPQCGSGIGEASADGGSVSDAASQEPTQHPLADEAARVAAALNEKFPPSATVPLAASGDQVEPSRPVTDATRGQQPDAPATMTPTTREESRATTQRQATTAAASTTAVTSARGGRIGQRAASVGDNLRPRVERLREASIVALDEASDDPGLRFVIIAVALFIIFLLFLLFSHILG